MHCNTYCGGACSETYGRAMATNKQSQIDKINIVEETEVELEEIKEEMPKFMLDHGMPIKALAWTGGKTPTELSAVLQGTHGIRRQIE